MPGTASVACLTWLWVSLPGAGLALLLAHWIFAGFLGMLQTYYPLTLSAVLR